MGHLGSTHLSHRLDRVLVHRTGARSRRRARPGTAQALASVLRRTFARLARLGLTLDAPAPGLSPAGSAGGAAGRFWAQESVRAVRFGYDSRLALDNLPAVF